MPARGSCWSMCGHFPACRWSGWSGKFGAVLSLRPPSCEGPQMIFSGGSRWKLPVCAVTSANAGAATGRSLCQIPIARSACTIFPSRSHGLFRRWAKVKPGRRMQQSLPLPVWPENQFCKRQVVSLQGLRPLRRALEWLTVRECPNRCTHSLRSGRAPRNLPIWPGFPQPSGRHE